MRGVRWPSRIDMRRFAMALCLLTLGCHRHRDIIEASSAYSAYGPCVPLPTPGPSWRRDSLPALGLCFRLPPEIARLADGHTYGLPDSAQHSPLFFATLSFTLARPVPTDSASTVVTYIDGVPASPGGRGSDSPRVERRCTVRLLEREGLLELTQTHGWGDGYGFLLRLPDSTGAELVVRGSTGAFSFRDQLLAVLQSIRPERAI
jgi:hypothetical protein